MITENNNINDTSVNAAVKSILQTLIDDTDLYIVDISVRGHTNSQIVDIFIDKDTGVEIAQCATISRTLGDIFEEREFFKGKYRLNVSSPGITQPIRIPRQFLRHIGRDFKIKYATDEKNVKTEGVLTHADEAGCTIRTKKGEEQTFLYEVIVEAKIKLPW